jgi:insertion element IS1 protein InsB
MNRGPSRPSIHFKRAPDGKKNGKESSVKGFFRTSCIQISGTMECQFCKGNCQKAGRQKNGAQKLYCKGCNKYQQPVYQNKACQGTVNPMISHLVCEGVGIRGIARVLQIGINTVLRRILAIADGIAKPIISKDQPSFEVDELWTYIGRKENEYWLAYALDKTNCPVMDFVIGKRTKATLKGLIDSLLASGVRKIRTDRLTHYQCLFQRVYTAAEPLLH